MSSACPVYGFEFSFRSAVDAADDAADELWTAFINVVERHGLCAGGGASGTEWRHVISRDGTQATDADRERLLAWANDRSDVLEAVAGPLVDLTADDG